MLARIATVFDCTAEQLWGEISRPASLRFVSAPLLYQALRFLELRPGLTWPDGAWAFSRLLGDPAARWLAAVSLALAALGFLSAGLGLFFGASWARTVTLGTAVFSVLIYLLFWNGKSHALPDQGGVGLLLSLGILLLALAFWSGPAPLQAGDGINSLEQVALDGVKQWISIRGVDRRAPVLLFLHGGPGSANIAKLRLQVPELERHFVVVNWDQRGAGKSFSPGFDSSTLSRQQLLSDAHELVGLLKDRFGVQKIYLMGFSWGTVLGLSLAEQYPDDFEAFISVSQVVDYQAGEKLSLAYVREAAQKAANAQAVAELASVDPAYKSPDWQAQIAAQRKWLLHFGGVYHTSSSYSHEIGMMLTAPEYSFVEVALWPMSSSNALKAMWPALMNLSLAESVPVVRCPVYFFVERHDYNSPWQLTEAYYQALNAPAGKRLIWFENSAHDLFFDEPRRLEQAVLAILETHGQP
jgi:pimeloyl-ACP methyl ester carboxylesterase